MYYRLYLTQVLLGYLFDLDDSNVSRVITRLRPLRLGVLPLPVEETVLFADDARKPRRRIGTLEEVFQKHPEFKEVLIDATEQEVPKPKNKTNWVGEYVISCQSVLLSTAAWQYRRSTNHLAIAQMYNQLELARHCNLCKEFNDGQGDSDE